MAGTSTRKVDGGRIPGAAAGQVVNCIQWKMFFLLANQKTAHTSFYGKSQGSFVASAAAANAMFTALAGHLSNRFGTWMNNQCRFEAVSVRDMSLSTNPEFRSTNASQVIGSNAGSLPQDVSIVLTAQCVERGRGSKGRLYLPGWANVTTTTSGAIDPTLVTAVTAFGGDLVNELNAVALGACIPKVHRQEYTGLSGAVHPERQPHIADVTGYVCQNNEFDTQRRRGL